jgi:hypothetical protein
MKDDPPMGLINIIRTGTRRGVYAISLACVATLVVAMRADAYALIDFDNNAVQQQTVVGRRRDATMHVLGARAMARWMVGWAMTYYALLFNQSCTAIECFEDAQEASKADAATKEKKDEGENKAKPSPSFGEIKYGQGGKRPRRVMIADRAMGNFLEQSLALLPALGAHFMAFGGSMRTARIAWMWLSARWFYFRAFRAGLPWFIFVTVPNYVCVFGLYVDLARFAGMVSF